MSQRQSKQRPPDFLQRREFPSYKTGRVPAELVPEESQQTHSGRHASGAHCHALISALTC